MNELIRDYAGLSQSFDDINIYGLESDDIVSGINEKFNKLVNVTMSDTTLHLVAILSCVDKDTPGQLKLMVDSCKKLKHKISLHILGLSSGLAKILDEDGNPSDWSRVQIKTENLLKEMSQDSSLAFSFTLIDDYAASGAAIGFTLESLARYLALIQLALGENYYSILSPSLLAAHPRNNLSVGVSSLSFPKRWTVKQLLGKSFLAALDKVGINKTAVDSQKAAHEAEKFLVDIENRYPLLYQTAIYPLYKEKELSESKVVAEAAEIIKSNLEELHNEIVSILKDDKFSMPEKEAILAMILGRDNTGLHGIQYEHEGALLDDACEEPINLYIKAYNEYCLHSKWLPVRKDFELLKKKKWNRLENKYEEDDENQFAMNPLPQIKRLKQQILNTTSFLREKHQELQALENSENLRSEAEKIKKQWKKPEGNLRNFDIREQPLDDRYIPVPNLEIKSSVDLRKFFLPVRSQEELGSCTSFAVASMYEAMQVRNGIDMGEYMSPGFIYYFSNIIKGRLDGGSNYHDQFEVLGKEGICREDLYEYKSKDSGKKPSQDAKEDAQKHRVLAARQIHLMNSSDKSNDLKHNHRMITSALSEGYPVGISLKVYDNLGMDGPFIMHPEDTPEAKEEGYHAMVIAGYSEDNGFYIVRNSWGVEFGDEGYCYIPTSYIDDPEYLDFACIITEITDSTEDNKREIPVDLANFAATETQIRIAAIRNAISIVRIELRENERIYSEYYKYYQKLMLRLTMPKVQNDIRKQAEVGQTKNFIESDVRKRKLEETFVSKIKYYKNYFAKIIISLFVVACGFGLVWFYTESLGLFIVFLITAVLGVLVWIGYKWWIRMLRHRLQEQLDAEAVNAQRQKNILLEMQIRFHIAGMWLSNFHQISIELNKLYDRLVSFNDTLRQWQKNYTDIVDEKYESDGIMFRSLDSSSKLEQFFREHKDIIVGKIDLLSVFKDYQAKEDDLEKSRIKLDVIVEEAIDSLMRDFNIVNYLLGEHFAYILPVDLQKEIDMMIQVGQPSYRNKEMNATTPVRMLMGKVENGKLNNWNNAVSPYFPLRPVLLEIADSTMIILLTLHAIEI